MGVVPIIVLDKNDKVDIDNDLVQINTIYGDVGIVILVQDEKIYTYVNVEDIVWRFGYFDSASPDYINQNLKMAAVTTSQNLRDIFFGPVSEVKVVNTVFENVVGEPAPEGLTLLARGEGVYIYSDGTWMFLTIH